MGTRRQLDRLIGAIYDAAADPRRWPRALTLLARCLEGSGTLLIAHRPGQPEPLWAEVGDLDPEALQAYASHYFSLDPRVGASEIMEEGDTFCPEQLIPRAAYRKSEIYNELLAPNDIVHNAAAVLAKNKRLMMSVVVQAGTDHGPFSQDELDMLRAVAPHLRRAVEIQFLITRAREERDALRQALAQLPYGWVLLDSEARVVFASPQAEAIFRRCDGISVRRRKLLILHARSRTRMNKLIDECVHPDDKPGAGGMMQIPRESGLRAYRVLVSPAGAGTHRPWGGSGSAFVFIFDPGMEDPLDPRPLEHLYGLTPAQARVAVLMANGCSVSQAADALGVSVNTCRAHLKAVYLKTGVNSQAQLAALLERGLTRMASLAGGGEWEDG